MENLGNRPQQLLGNPGLLYRALAELQGVNFTLIPGAAAGAKVNIANIRPADTIKSVFAMGQGAWARWVDDTANTSILSCNASGTVTVSGNPTEGDTATVNGNVYTFRAVPLTKQDVKITAGNNNTMAAALAAAINGYEARYEAQLKGDSFRKPAVTAVVAANVVTVTAVAEGVGGNAITLAKAGANLAVSGATLAGGTATGGIKSTSDNSAKDLLVVWYKHVVPSAVTVS